MTADFPPSWLEGLVRWLALYGTGESPSNAPIGIAFSAGADSTALLMAVHALWPGRVVALHVHHGMQDAADGFEQQARQTCERLDVPLFIRRLQMPVSPGRSPEEMARSYRYESLAEMAREAGVSAVLLAQHADDQAETVMLALSRGAGMPGLAAMAACFERHGMGFGRPWLNVRAADIRQWLTQRQIPFADDPTNGDEAFTRNRIRATLSPAWERCFPGYAKAMARTARHAAEASVLLDELAEIDLAAVGTPPRIADLQKLSTHRQGNVLRYWLKTGPGVQASAAQLAELISQLSACRTRGHAIELKVASGTVRRSGERLDYLPPV